MADVFRGKLVLKKSNLKSEIRFEKFVFDIFLDSVRIVDSIGVAEDVCDSLLVEGCAIRGRGRRKYKVSTVTQQS